MSYPEALAVKHSLGGGAPRRVMLERVYSHLLDRQHFAAFAVPRSLPKLWGSQKRAVENGVPVAVSTALPAGRGVGVRQAALYACVAQDCVALTTNHVYGGVRNQALDVLQHDVWACFGYLAPLMVPNLIRMLGDKESSYEQVLIQNPPKPLSPRPRFMSAFAFAPAHAPIHVHIPVRPPTDQLANSLTHMALR